PGSMSRFPRRRAISLAALVTVLLVVVFTPGCGPYPRPRAGPPAAPAPAAGANAPPTTAPPAAAPAPPPVPDACLVSRFVPPGKDTVKIFAPTTFAGRQLFETLVRLDCSGQLRPELAVSWHAEDRGATWVLTLRPGARYWDGRPVTPAGIA